MKGPSLELLRTLSLLHQVLGSDKTALSCRRRARRRHPCETVLIMCLLVSVLRKTPMSVSAFVEKQLPCTTIVKGPKRLRNYVCLGDQKQKEREIAQAEGNNTSNDPLVSSPLFSQEGADPHKNWTGTTGGSIGSLLMQMQKQEEELRAGNESTSLEDQAIKLDARNVTSSGFDQIKKDINKRKKSKEPSLQRTSKEQEVVQDHDDDDDATSRREALSGMDSATARELDDAITWMVSAPESKSELLDSVKVLPLPSLYASTIQTSPKESTSLKTPEGITKETVREAREPLSMPDHYRDRIGRDMRHLAVSVASSIEDIDQWRTFCREGNGGLMPLLECIREGAHFINIQKQQQNQKNVADYEAGVFLQQHEESFMAACSACRALRDLCAVSPELSSVITDGILRANAGWSTPSISTGSPSRAFLGLHEKIEKIEPKHVHQAGNNLMSDFMTMLRYANDYTEPFDPRRKGTANLFRRSKSRRDARLRCKLYVTQLLLAMTVSSDDAVEAIRDAAGLPETILKSSSYSFAEKSRRWLRYPGEAIKSILRRKRKNISGDEGQAESAQQKVVRPFVRAAEVQNNLDGHVRRTANQVLAAIGYNRWVPKIPGQKGLRILCLDGGGSRGMVAVSIVKGLVEAMDGVEVADSFDIIAGTSTGGIISFLCGLRRESSVQAVERYNQLIKQIFVKSALSTPMMLFTTATYDESSFMTILSEILEDSIMLDSRADPAVPYVFCVASKMSSTPTHVALFRNYNYAGGELADPFTIDPDRARLDLDLPLELEHDLIRKGSYVKRKQIRRNSGYEIEGSRHPGSFRVLQRYALRASTAAPTVFKPVMMGGEMYCDGGIVASNPAAVAVHEARSIFPDIPIEMVVSVGTGGFLEQKNSPRIGWDGIIGQIVNSATDAEQVHHLLEDILGEGGTRGIKRGSHVSQTRYYRLNPTLGLPDEFPIDETDPVKLQELKNIARDYLKEPAQQKKLAEIGDILQGRRGWRKWLP